MKIRFGKYGVHLFNRVTGTNVLFDEVVLPENLWSIAPRHVSIALTNACDLSCRYCYASKKRAELDPRTVKNWLHELDLHGSFGVGFGGGEPTIYRHFVELCKYVATNTDLAVSFTTHGHHLTDKLLEEIEGSVHFARISVDGLDDTYERLRNRSFRALQRKITTLKKIVPFGINYVVNEETLPDLNDAIDFAESFGASEFLLLPEYNANRILGFSPIILEALSKFVKGYSKRVPLRISKLSSFGIPNCDPYRDEAELSSYVHVDAQGTLKPTSYCRVGIKISSLGLMDSLRQLRNQVENTN